MQKLHLLLVYGLVLLVVQRRILWKVFVLMCYWSFFKIFYWTEIIVPFESLEYSIQLTPKLLGLSTILVILIVRTLFVKLLFFSWLLINFCIKLQIYSQDNCLSNLSPIITILADCDHKTHLIILGDTKVQTII